MKQEDKELLLKDLCARLPYQPQVEIIKDGTSITNKLTTATINYLEGGYWDVKPYLFPLSSMTEEQKKEFIKYACYEKRDEDCGRHIETYYYDMVGHEDSIYPNSDAIDWLNKNHFDYRGLIEKGLAINATGLNIY